jgi:hypothetical protein
VQAYDFRKRNRDKRNTSANPSINATEDHALLRARIATVQPPFDVLGLLLPDIAPLPEQRSSSFCHGTGPENVVGVETLWTRWQSVPASFSIVIWPK